MDVRTSLSDGYLAVCIAESLKLFSWFSLAGPPNTCEQAREVLTRYFTITSYYCTEVCVTSPGQALTLLSEGGPRSVYRVLSEILATSLGVQDL